MKCPYCGGEVNTKKMYCKYCDSKIEVEEHNTEDTNPERTSTYRSNVNNSVNHMFRYTTSKRALKIVFGVIAGVVAFSVIIQILLIVIPTIIAIFFAVGTSASHYTSTTQVQEQQELLVDKLPRSATDLVGRIVDCTTGGEATICYNDEFYHDVQIQDSAFIDWLTEEGINPSDMHIMFSTDESRNITSVYLKEPDFVVMYREDNTYVAFNDDEKIITFETDTELEIDAWYTGYFHYSNKEFHGAVAVNCNESYGQFYYTCKEKATPTEYCFYTDKEVMVYKLLVGNDWYYCSKDTFEMVNVGDDMEDDYTFVLAKAYVYQ